VFHDLPECFLVLLTVEDCQSNAGVTKTARSTDSVHVVLVVWKDLAILSLDGDIEVNDELDLVHVEAAREKICGNDGTDRSCSELLNVFISLFFRHLSEDDCALVPIVLKLHEEELCELQSVHENDGLCVLREGVIDLFDEVDLALGLALVVELLDVVELD